MPVPPVELTAELTIEDASARQAALDAAAGSLRALETGPATVALTGARREVLDALLPALEAAVAAGARQVRVTLEQPTESRDD